MRRSSLRFGHHRTIRSTLRAVSAVASSSVLLATGLTLLSSSNASAAPAPPGPCNEKVATGPGTAVHTPSGILIVGIVAGTTQVTVDCNASSAAAYAVEASLLGGIAASSVTAANVADLSSLATFAVSATDTGCPAAVAGSCTLTTFTFPASFSAGDPNAVCPPTQAQINAGLFGCAVAVTTSSLVPVPSAEFLVTYASQTTLPGAPTIVATPATGAAGSSVVVSDAPASTHYWWADAVQAIQAAALGVTPAPAPATCAAGGGYGNVPVFPFLTVKWFATGNPTPINGSAAGVTISNACFEGTTLHAPVLGGTVPVPASVVAGTHYTVYLCELNGTPYPSNDASAATNCGPTPVPGASWIDASFSFSAVVGVITQVAPTSGAVSVAGSTTLTAQLAVSGNNGAVTYSQFAPGPDLAVSASGVVTTKRTLVAGTYSATGTTADPSGDVGTFSYSLVVGTLTQTSPASGTVTTTGSSTFTQPLAVSGNNGSVTYVKTGGSPSLTVSGAVIATTATLGVGSYSATGTMSDPNGDSGTFAFTLSVTAAAPAGPRATRVIGHAMAGKSVTMKIVGSGFYGKPKITGHAGTKVTVSRDTGTLLTIRVTAAAHSHNGTYTFTITLANGKSCKIRYSQSN